MSSYESEASLGQSMFGHAQLGDARRTRRLAATFDALQRHPGGTLPQKLASPADLKALYRLCECDEVTHAAIVAAVRLYTLARMAAHQGEVLIIHDATELDYTTLCSLADDLGQIGKGTRRGFICQNVLAVAAETGEVLGLLDQILHCRDEVPEDETLTELRNRPTRESLLWVRGAAELPSDWRLIDVADQGASTFEFLEHETKSGRRFVIRNGKPRKVHAGQERKGPRHDLKTYAKSLPELGRFVMDVQPQGGRSPRQARQQAEFAIRGGSVLVLRPHAKAGHHGNDPLPLYVVLVSEVKPPKGEKPIEWLLLTNEPVQTLADAERVVGWYERRWIIEEYHKALKTGCQIEDLQFTCVSRLQPAIALLSAVALTLLSLRDASRRPDAKARRATTLFAREYVEVLSLWRHRRIRIETTIHDFFYALARLGGHQNRKHDSRPGWLVLWRGWIKLQLMLDGYEAAKQKKCG
jgi:transposase-like protein/DDE family transposase